MIERRQAVLEAIEDVLPGEVDATQAILTAQAAAPAKPVREEYPADFEATWAVYPARFGGNPKKESFKHWNARRREGVTAEDLHAGTERYAAYCASAGKVGTEFVLQGATFFGTSKRYAEQWPVARLNATVPNGRTPDPKFHPNASDYSSSRAAMERTMLQHGISVDDEEHITF